MSIIFFEPLKTITDESYSRRWLVNAIREKVTTKNNNLKNRKNQKKMKTINFLFLCLITLSLSSCATILSGRYDKVTITSNPPNADVFVDGEKVGNTESTGNTILIKRKYVNSRSITLKKEGYQDLTWEAKTKIHPTFYIGAIPVTFGIPCFIDIATGSALTMREKQFTKELTPKQ